MTENEVMERLFDDICRLKLPVSDILLFNVEGKIIHINTVTGSYRLKNVNLSQLTD